MFNGRTLAVAFWGSFFALYWLLILGFVETQGRMLGALVFFFLGATLISVQVAMSEDVPPRKRRNNRDNDGTKS